MLASDAALREYCDRHYHQLLPIIDENIHQEKVQQEKLKEVKARLKLKERVKGDRGVFNWLGGKGKSVSAHSESRYQSSRLERIESVPKKRHHEGTCSRRTEMLSESEDSGGGHWKSKSKK
ncbi:hypothetical protein Tco_1502886 [Tanacetum coccineum]